MAEVKRGCIAVQLHRLPPKPQPQPYGRSEERLYSGRINRLPSQPQPQPYMAEVKRGCITVQLRPSNVGRLQANPKLTKKSVYILFKYIQNHICQY